MMPRSQRDDYHLLSREQQVVLVRLCNSRNRLNSHMHHKLKLASSPTCLCQSVVKKTRPQSMFYKDASSTKLQEKMSNLSALPCNQTLQLQAGAGEDNFIYLLSGPDRVACECQEDLCIIFLISLAHLLDLHRLQ